MISVALIVTVCAPSSSASSTASRLTVTDGWPAGIVALAGTVASVGSLLVRLTTSSLVVLAVRVIVTVVAAGPAFSTTVVAPKVTVSVARR